MRTLVERPKVTQQAVSPKSAIPGQAHLGQSCSASSTLHLQRTIGNQAVRPRSEANMGDVEGHSPTFRLAPFGHDFSRIPVFAEQVSEDQQGLRASGEMEGGSLNGREEWLPATGDGGASTPAPAPGLSRLSPFAPRLLRSLVKSTVSPLSTQNNGGFNWGVRWSIQNAVSSTNGWIVQHVALRQNVTNAAGATVVPGRGVYGGLPTAWYPLWEAWRVRNGAVLIGDSTAPHNADTYAQNAVGSRTKGQTEIVGRADFYPDLTLPASFAVRAAAPAWSLPVTNTNPNLTGGTGALDHNLTAVWDSVGVTGATTATIA
jgi:hypothetical protein